MSLTARARKAVIARLAAVALVVGAVDTAHANTPAGGAVFNVPAPSVSLNCWAAAAYRYQLPVDLLYAIGWVESSHNPRAISKPNKNGTVDIGLMQINESWLPVLAKYGVTRRDLIEKPCTNIQVGAWILATEVSRTGYTWYSIGAYNAGPITPKTGPKARARKIATYRVYAGKVIERWKALAAMRASATPNKPAATPAPLVKAAPPAAPETEVASAGR